MELRDIYQRRRILKNYQKKLNKKIMEEEKIQKELIKRRNEIEKDIKSNYDRIYFNESICEYLDQPVTFSVIEFFDKVITGKENSTLLILIFLASISPQVFATIMNCQFDKISSVIISIITFAITTGVHAKLDKIERKILINKTQSELRNEKYNMKDNTKKLNETIERLKEDLPIINNKYEETNKKITKYQQRLNEIKENLKIIDDLISIKTQEYSLENTDQNQKNSSSYTKKLT